MKIEQLTIGTVPFHELPTSSTIIGVRYNRWTSEYVVDLWIFGNAELKTYEFRIITDSTPLEGNGWAIPVLVMEGLMHQYVTWRYV